MSDAIPETPAGASAASPWPRFFARQIDYLLFGMIFGVVHSMVLTDFLDLPWVLFSPLTTFAWIPPEAVLLALFGTTPGKWTFSLRVVRADGDKLLLGAALVRSVRVWIQGMALGIPPILLVTNWLGYKQLTSRGITSWDERTPSTTQQAPLSGSRMVTAIALVAACLALLSWGLQAGP
jgi:uncharacterized RDD family membrane protein YckC